MSVTPASIMLNEGTYTVSVATRIEGTPTYIFKFWSDGDTSPTKTITLNTDQQLTAIFQEELRPVEPTRVTPYSFPWANGTYRIGFPSKINVSGVDYDFDHVEES